MAPTREEVRESSDRVREAPKQKETRGRGEVSLREERIATASALRVGDHTQRTRFWTSKGTRGPDGVGVRNAWGF